MLSFFVGLAFSYLGSIPPGTLNLTVLQMSLEGKARAAFRFSLAAAFVEYPYAFIAVKSEELILSSPAIVDNFELIAVLVMLILALFNLLSKPGPSSFVKITESGFRKGMLLSILNPLAIPFWIGVTAYLKEMHWVKVNSTIEVAIYVLGISVGTFLLLATLILVGNKIAVFFKHSSVVQKIPGIVFLILAAYAFLNYFNLV